MSSCAAVRGSDNPFASSATPRSVFAWRTPNAADPSESSMHNHNRVMKIEVPRTVQRCIFQTPAGCILRGRDPFEKISRHCGNYQEVPEHKSSLQVQVCSGFITFAFVFPGVSPLQTAPLPAPRCHGCCALDKDAQDGDDDDDDVVCCTLLFSCCFCMLKNHIRCEMIVPLCDSLCANLSFTLNWKSSYNPSRPHKTLWPSSGDEKQPPEQQQQLHVAAGTGTY